MKLINHQSTASRHYPDANLTSIKLRYPSLKIHCRWCSIVYLSFLVLSIASSLIPGCTSHKHGDANIFHYNESTGIATLDPAFAKNQSVMWAVHQIYNTLIETDDRLSMKPSLAKAWDVTSDRLTYLFHLRTNVLFHDNEAFPGGKGRRLTAYDVEYSFNRIRDKATASSGAWIFNGKVDSLGGFKALDDSTFRIHLISPFNPILGLLSMQYCSVVPREVVERYGKDFS